MQKYSFKTIVRVAIPLILLVIFTFFLNKTVVSNPQEIRNWLAGFGAYAIIAYVVAQVTAIVIAPLGGSAFALAILALFGPFVGALTIYLVTTPAYLANFLIARRYGNKIVQKFVGNEGEAIISRFLTGLSVKKLIVMKVFLGGYFDYISYATGLSHISLRSFFIINIVGGIPGAFFTWSVMYFSPNFMTGVAILYTVPILMGGLFIGTSQYRKKKREATETPETLLEHEV